MIFLQAIPKDTVNVADSAKVALQEAASQISTDPEVFFREFGQQALQFGLKVLAALIIYVVGVWLIRRINGLLRRGLEKRKAEKTLATFVSSLVSISLTILLIVITISTLGINTTSLAAVLAAGGMAIGMALSGTVQNFAGGIMILVFKPFKVGDFIEAQGFAGTVEEVTMVSTKIRTTDNRSVILPNGALSNGNINNFSIKELRRVDLTVDITYGDDADACSEFLKDLIRSDERVLDASTPGADDPFVEVLALKESSVQLVTRSWVRAADYWPVYFSLNRAIYRELPRAGFHFPFPQLDVHIDRKKS